MGFLYSFAWLMALTLSAPWWLWKMATTHKYREGLWERLGRVPERVMAAGDARPLVWVHAVSVGEVIAVSRLVRELARATDHRVVVSTTTLTGQRVARERFGAENVFYYPLDLRFPVRRYLRLLRPRLFVLAETEFWPRMLAQCRRAGIPVAVVNARISDRSYPRYRRLRFLWVRILRGLAVVLAQSREDVERLRAIGAPAERVEFGGNLKYDVAPSMESAVVEAIQRALPADARLLVCGSTLEGEERLLLQAWPRLIAEAPTLRMVLAPRHPERFGSVAELLQESGLRWFRRTTWLGSGQALEAGAILLLDSIGELASVYSLGAAAFVGGSLVAAGGHNPLEPARFGVPVLMGDHYENFRGIVESLQGQRAIRIVSASHLAAELLEVLTSRAGVEMGGRGREVFAAEAGATQRAVDALSRLLAAETRA